MDVSSELKFEINQSLSAFISVNRSAKYISNLISENVQFKDVTFNQFFFLENLYQVEIIEPNLLVKKISIDTNEFIQTFNILFNRNFIKKTYQSNKHSFKIQLTKMGHSFVEENLNSYYLEVSKIMNILDEDEKETLKKVCKKLETYSNTMN